MNIGDWVTFTHENGDNRIIYKYENPRHLLKFFREEGREYVDTDGDEHGDANVVVEFVERDEDVERGWDVEVKLGESGGDECGWRGGDDMIVAQTGQDIAGGEGDLPANPNHMNRLQRKRIDRVGKKTAPPPVSGSGSKPAPERKVEVENLEPVKIDDL